MWPNYCPLIDSGHGDGSYLMVYKIIIFMTLWADPALSFFGSNIQNLVTPLTQSDAELIEVSGKNRLVEILWLNSKPAVNRQPSFRREDS